MEIVSIANVETNEYFYSTNHCQPMSDNNWVPCTAYLPYRIAPREGFESGILETFEEYDRFESHYGVRVPNPNPEYAIEEDIK